jgi:hypothetical protein
MEVTHARETVIFTGLHGVISQEITIAVRTSGPALHVSEQGAELCVEPNSEEVTGYWRKVHIEEHHNLYSPLNISNEIKEDIMDRTCHMHGRIAYITVA